MDKESWKFMFVLSMSVIVLGWGLPLFVLGHVETNPIIAVIIALVSLVFWVVTKRNEECQNKSQELNPK